ncbi:MAG: hypothetical protein IH623_29815 [Verrucomicrobia bacterium]|nr:hypothetical protein [Verrucomicrobiota bacterium]
MPGNSDSNRARPALSRSAWALLLVALLALSLPLVSWLFRPGGHAAADAEARLKRSQANLETATRVVHSTEGLAQRLVSSNSASYRTVQSLGQGVIQTLQRENLGASLDVALVRKFEAADHCIQTYQEFNQAQLAMAAINLSGINSAVLRPVRGPELSGQPVRYELKVPRDLAATAVTVLTNTQISEVRRYRDALAAMSARRELETQGVQAAICPLKIQGQAPTEERMYSVFVRSSNEPTAKALLDGSLR